MSDWRLTKWLLQRLADQLDVAAARPGEEAVPYIRLEQPWPQWLLVFTFLGSAALIIWLYWHEGKASRASKLFLAGLRIVAGALGDVHAFRGGAVGPRDGLPYLTILVDDSASQRIADQYEKPEVKKRSSMAPAWRRRSRTRRPGWRSPRG